MRAVDVEHALALEHVDHLVVDVAVHGGAAWGVDPVELGELGAADLVGAKGGVDRDGPLGGVARGAGRLETPLGYRMPRHGSFLPRKLGDSWGVGPSRIGASFAASMSPPETMQTTVPSPPRPASAA